MPSRGTPFFLILIIVSCTLFSPPNISTYLVEVADEARPPQRAPFDHTASEFMVVTQSPMATQAALKILQQGGNVFDAGITASFVLSVVRPQSTGLGGGGFAFYYLPEMREPLSLDFREVAPYRAYEKMFLGPNQEVLKEKAEKGSWSVAVPGFVAGMDELHKNYGHLPFEKLIEPAILLAEEGFPIYPELAKSIESKKELLNAYESTRKIFFNQKGDPLKTGDLLLQKDLAQSLRKIAQLRSKGFYQGEIAKAIIAEQDRLGGMITQKDLDNYKTVFRKPLQSSYLEYDVYTMAPPSSGGVHLLELLNIIENFPIKKWGNYSTQTLHHLISAMQLVYADRAKYLGDTDFVDVPIKGLISKKYAQLLATQIPPNRAMSQYEISPGHPESVETHHFTIMDKKGGVFTSTQTLNGPFGSGIIVPQTGILLNNQMDDFSAKVGVLNQFGAVGGYNNLIAPHKRPLSSMSPTIVMKKGVPLMALGSPGGTRIITCVFQTLINYLTFKQSLFDAIHTTRYHHQWYPNWVQIEEAGHLPHKTVEKLQSMGYEIRYDPIPCRVQAIAVEKGKLHGVSDMRGSGMASGI